MKTSTGNTVLGVLTALALGIGNALHIPWTVSLVVEQLETGWGYTTDLEMLVLAPWMVELLCVPAIVAGLVFFLLCGKKPVPKATQVAAAVLYGVLLAQIAVTNLFIFM